MFRTFGATVKSFFTPSTKGHPGESRDDEVFCPLLDDWIGKIVPCLEICDERGDYLGDGKDVIEIDSASQFNRASKRAGFHFPENIKDAVNVCLFCQAVCQDSENSTNCIPPVEKIDREELLRMLDE